MSFDQKKYSYSYPIDTEDPGFLNWFRPRYAKMNIVLILLVILVQPFDPFLTIFCPFVAIVATIFLSDKQKSLTAITQPLIAYLSLAVAILGATAIQAGKDPSNQEAIFCPIVFSPFQSQKCVPVDTLYDILHEPKTMFVFFNLFIIGYIVSYVHSGIIMLGTVRRKFMGGVPYITKYLRKYVCEVLPQIQPLKEDFLHHLSHLGHAEKLKQLFEEGKFIKEKILIKKDHYGRSPLELAGDFKTFSLLAQSNADLDFTNEFSGQNLIHIYSRRGNIDILDFLLKKGLDINHKDVKGRTPVDYAKNKQVESFLLSKGAKKTFINMIKILNYFNIAR